MRRDRERVSGSVTKNNEKGGSGEEEGDVSVYV